MKILLVNIDSTIPNLALEKIRVYHEQKGNFLVKIKDMSMRVLPFISEYDKIYVSCVFDYNKHFCEKWEGIAEIGGSGYSLTKRLPLEIEKIRPKINLGFTTRGCIRNCSFCIVQEKEGMIHAVADIYDIWDRKAQDIMLMDNNILAMPKHFFKITGQIKKEHLKIDFNQGLDHRLLTNRICEELLSLKYSGASKLRFAFDHISYTKSVLKALRMLKKHGLKKRGTRWYVYVGTEDTVETVLKRINILRDAEQVVFLMRDRKVQDNPKFMKIYQWTCNVAFFFTESYPPKKLPEIIDNGQTLFN